MESSTAVTANPLTSFGSRLVAGGSPGTFKSDCHCWKTIGQLSIIRGAVKRSPEFWTLLILEGCMMDKKPLFCAENDKLWSLGQSGYWFRNVSAKL